MEMAPDLLHHHLLDVLEDSVLPYKERSLQNLEPKCSSSPEYRVVNITPMGDVPHVFSHIKKTYRVQWVVIEGGCVPPVLKCGPGQPSSDHGTYNTPKNAFWASVTNVTEAKYVYSVRSICVAHIMIVFLQVLTKFGNMPWQFGRLRRSVRRILYTP